MTEKRGKGIPFAKGSETSADAADSMEKPSLRLRSKVRLYLYECGPSGATDEEIQLALDMAPNTQRPRRLELEKMGAIRKLYVDGKQVKRLTVTTFEQDGTTALTATDLKLFFEVVHLAAA